MDRAARAWWRDRLGVPAGWYVGHRFDADGRALRVDVADGSIVECVVRVPPGTSLAADPVVVVPAYRAEIAAGEVTGDRAFATQLASRGMVAVAVSWWFESMVDPEADSLAGRYAPAVAVHRYRHAGTGLGRSTADLVAVLDALEAEGVRRFGCFGHSLGGKLAIHLAGFDERVTATVASEPGVGLAFSNWAAPWYLDGRTLDRDHDDLLGLIPPRRFLLVAGGDADGPHNAHLLSGIEGVDVLAHDEGHGPPRRILDAAYDWLAAALDSRSRRGFYSGACVPCCSRRRWRCSRSGCPCRRRPNRIPNHRPNHGEPNHSRGWRPPRRWVGTAGTSSAATSTRT